MNLAHLFRRLFPFICLSLLGCSLLPSEIKIAEKMMESAPDSALNILRQVHTDDHLMPDADKALYGLLLFQALDKNKLTLKPDSAINFSIEYYQNENDKPHLANAYFYKGRMYKNAQHYDEATLLYLKALDNFESKKNYILLGKIYADMGDICSIQMDYNVSREKYQLSVDYFNLAGEPIEASYRILDIGRTYRLEKKYKAAQKIFLKALTKTNDSVFSGVAFQEIGINYYWAKQYDSAQFYLRKSIQFPYESTNYAIRCYQLADLYFDVEQYDSAYLYATIALKYPANFFTQRECYRVLANTEYVKGDFKQMAHYMTNFQSCTDSVRKVEIQTKSTVLEGIHQTSQNAGKSKQYFQILAWLLPLIVFLSLIILIRLRKRNKGKEQQLDLVEEELNLKQTLLSEKQSQLSEKQIQLIEKHSLLKANLISKIEDTRLLYVSEYKTATLVRREQMDLELYVSCLYIDDWKKFAPLMNHTFNNIVSVMETSYPDITHKEIIWSCLFLLNTPTSKILLLLDYKTDSLYKLKQRMVQKMSLNNAKELDIVIKELVEKNNQ